MSCQAPALNRWHIPCRLTLRFFYPLPINTNWCQVVTKYLVENCVWNTYLLLSHSETPKKWSSLKTLGSLQLIWYFLLLSSSLILIKEYDCHILRHYYFQVRTSVYPYLLSKTCLQTHNTSVLLTIYF